MNDWQRVLQLLLFGDERSSIGRRHSFLRSSVDPPLALVLSVAHSADLLSFSSRAGDTSNHVIARKRGVKAELVEIRGHSAAQSLCPTTIRSSLSSAAPHATLAARLRSPSSPPLDQPSLPLHIVRRWAPVSLPPLTHNRQRRHLQAPLRTDEQRRSTGQSDWCVPLEGARTSFPGLSPLGLLTERASNGARSQDPLTWSGRVRSAVWLLVCLLQTPLTAALALLARQIDDPQADALHIWRLILAVYASFRSCQPSD